ncbi:MAG TPA: hypothetical protein VLV56_00030 [Burkholderiales bacterium]|nr:hypothetical protein [Burkholderiales bacterium]
MRASLNTVRGIIGIAVMILGAIELSGCAIVVGAMVVDGVQYYSMGPDGTSMYRAPEPDPARAINAQDCTQPVDLSSGNLLCR